MCSLLPSLCPFSLSVSLASSVALMLSLYSSTSLSLRGVYIRRNMKTLVINTLSTNTHTHTQFTHTLHTVTLTKGTCSMFFSLPMLPIDTLLLISLLMLRVYKYILIFSSSILIDLLLVLLSYCAKIYKRFYLLQ